MATSVGSRVLAILATAALLVTACSREHPTGGHPAGEQPAKGRLSWSDCGDGFECAELAVPLDHGQPDGERIAISVTRLPASGDRIGSLVVNPGGPGSSGVDYARAADLIVSDEVRARFDIVGFDPRGVGRSAPVECVNDEGLDAFIALDTTPDDARERAELERASREFAAGCQARSGRLLPHVGTVDAARDMDALREALGDQKLTYLGKSYGTFLGAIYADMYPGRVRALVLDGALDPAISRFQLNTDQAVGFETALRAYVEHCVGGLGGAKCPFRSRDTGAALAEITALLGRTDTRPLPGGDRQATEALVTLGLATPLYSRTGWASLSETLSRAFAGDGTQLVRNADQLLDRRDDGHYSNQTESNMAINCMDSPYPRNPSSYATAAADAARKSPRFGAYFMWSSLPCAYWPAKPTFENHPLRAKGAPPILVVGTKRDPATPYPWAEALARQLESGVLLGVDGDGHTAYKNDSACVDDAVDRYLLTRAVPQNGTICPGIG